MIYHIVGRLGSGKTMYAVNKIVETLVYSNREVYTNIRLVDFWDYHLSNYLCKGFKSFIKFIISPIDDFKSFKMYLASKYVSRYHYIPDLKDAVAECFKLGSSEENSRWFIWDEVHLDLNSRMWKTTSTDMIKFFAMSRKLGFNVLMISQLRDAVDRQMRDLADVSYMFKNLKHFRPFGIPIIPFNIGILTKRWANKGFDRSDGKSVFIGAGVVRYSSEIGHFYDTMQIVSEKIAEVPKVWYTSEKQKHCLDCVYLQYYFKFCNFISLYYPHDREMDKNMIIPEPRKKWLSNFSGLYDYKR